MIAAVGIEGGVDVGAALGKAVGMSAVIGRGVCVGRISASVIGVSIGKVVRVGGTVVSWQAEKKMSMISKTTIRLII